MEDYEVRDIVACAHVNRAGVPIPEAVFGVWDLHIGDLEYSNVAPVVEQLVGETNQVVTVFSVRERLGLVEDSDRAEIEWLAVAQLVAEGLFGAMAGPLPVERFPSVRAHRAAVAIRSRAAHGAERTNRFAFLAAWAETQETPAPRVPVTVDVAELDEFAGGYVPVDEARAAARSHLGLNPTKSVDPPMGKRGPSGSRRVKPVPVPGHLSEVLNQVARSL